MTQTGTLSVEVHATPSPEWQAILDWAEMTNALIEQYGHQWTPEEQRIRERAGAVIERLIVPQHARLGA